MAMAAAVGSSGALDRYETVVLLDPPTSTRPWTWPSTTRRQVPEDGGPPAQDTAAFTSAMTFFSTAGLHLLSANDTGHRSPSSRLAASWKPSVE